MRTGGEVQKRFENSQAKARWKNLQLRTNHQRSSMRKDFLQRGLSKKSCQDSY